MKSVCANGLLIFEGRRKEIPNPNHETGSRNWKKSREYAHYLSEYQYAWDKGLTLQAVRSQGQDRYEAVSKVLSATLVQSLVFLSGYTNKMNHKVSQSTHDLSRFIGKVSLRKNTAN